VSAFGAGDIHKGTVTYAEDAGQYTYLKVKEGKDEKWIAVNKMDVKVGETVEYAGGLPMENFESKTLKKKFEKILFVSRIHVPGKEGAPKSQMPADELHKGLNKPEAPKGNIPADALHKGMGKGGKILPPEKGSIKAPKGALTVEALYKDSTKLNGKEVLLRAKVLKVSNYIMGKNWITLSDGTGKAPLDTIKATTQELLSPGQTITLKGILKTDVNLGSGYHYKVLIEKVTIKK
jgi:hypothetical protein